MTKTKKKTKVSIKEEGCKGCELCVEFCKQNVLKPSNDLNNMGYHFVEVVDQEACTACMVCTLVCPDVIIEVYSE